MGRSILILVLAIGLAGCSSSSSTTSNEITVAPEPDQGSVALVINATGLARYSSGTASSEPLEAGLTFAGLASRAPSSDAVAIAVQRGETTSLSLIGADGSRREIHQQDGQTSYTVAWAPTGDSLVFGYRSATGRGIGYYALTSGNTIDVGCSASDRALSWGYSDWFLVANDQNHYVIDRNGCDTVESTDSRKFHEVTFDQSGKQMAYILRELEYDRTTRQYRPDSSLHVSSTTGQSSKLVVGDRYKPHRPDWSPDGASLSFDARLLDEPTRRLISIYDVAARRSAFLNPTAVEGDLSEWGAVWSPSGEAIAYMQSNGGSSVVAVRAFSETFSAVIGHPDETIVGWLDAERIVLTGPSSTRIVSSDGSQSIDLEAGVAVIGLLSD